MKRVIPIGSGRSITVYAGGASFHTHKRVERAGLSATRKLSPGRSFSQAICRAHYARGRQRQRSRQSERVRQLRRGMRLEGCDVGRAVRVGWIGKDEDGDWKDLNE